MMVTEESSHSHQPTTNTASRSTHQGTDNTSANTMADSSNNRPRGMQNHSNCCFINSTLQCLFSTPDHQNQTGIPLIPAQPQNNNDTPAQGLCRAYQEAANNYHLPAEPGRTLDSDAHMEFLRANAAADDRFTGETQQDANEYLVFLLDQIKQGVTDQNKAKGEGQGLSHSLRDTFLMKLATNRHCLECNTVKTESEEHVMLNLPLLSEDTAHDSTLRDYQERTPTDIAQLLSAAQQTEPVPDYDCETCNINNNDPKRKKTKMTQKSHILCRTGNAVIVMLNRFSTQTVTRKGIPRFVTKKIHRRVYTPGNLRLGTRWYSLGGVIYHHGKTPQEGHYTAAVRRGDTWYECDDTTVSELPLEWTPTVQGQQQDAAQSNTYLAFYHLTEDNELLPDDDDSPSDWDNGSLDDGYTDTDDDIDHSPRSDAGDNGQTDEVRVDPMLDNSIVTYRQMCKGHIAEELTEDQLKEHWDNLQTPDKAPANRLNGGATKQQGPRKLDRLANIPVGATTGNSYNNDFSNWVIRDCPSSPKARMDITHKPDVHSTLLLSLAPGKHYNRRAGSLH